MQRPNAKTLLSHRFVKGAKKTSYLTELIDRYERWLAEHDGEGSESSEDSDTDKAEGGEQGWEFGTQRQAKGGAAAVAKKQPGKSCSNQAIMSSAYKVLA